MRVWVRVRVRVRVGVGVGVRVRVEHAPLTSLIDHLVTVPLHDLIAQPQRLGRRQARPEEVHTVVVVQPHPDAVAASSQRDGQRLCVTALLGAHDAGEP